MFQVKDRVTFDKNCFVERERVKKLIEKEYMGSSLKITAISKDGKEIQLDYKDWLPTKYFKSVKVYY